MKDNLQTIKFNHTLRNNGSKIRRKTKAIEEKTWTDGEKGENRKTGDEEKPEKEDLKEKPE